MGNVFWMTLSWLVLHLHAKDHIDMVVATLVDQLICRTLGDLANMTFGRPVRPRLSLVHLLQPRTFASCRRCRSLRSAKCRRWNSHVYHNIRQSVREPLPNAPNALHLCMAAARQGDTVPDRGFLRRRSCSYARLSRSTATCSSLADYAAGFLASAVSTATVYPVETYKVRLQAGNPFEKDSGESPLELLRGIELGLSKECPNAAVYLGVYEWLRQTALEQPQLKGLEDDPLTIFCIALICGALGDAAGSPLRLPFELVGKNVQAGRSERDQPFGEALAAALPAEDAGNFLAQTWLAILARDMPFGALQLCFYELSKLAVTPYFGDTFYAHLLEGGIAGACTAIVTTPIDCSITRLMLIAEEPSLQPSDGVARGKAKDIFEAGAFVLEEQGPVGLTRGWNIRALQFAPAAMVFFAAYESFKRLLLNLAGGQ